MSEAYLIIDVGTGNLRVAVASTKGEILGLQRSDIEYINDPDYPDSLYFDPSKLWLATISLAKEAILQAGQVKIIGVTATSQREGIVLLNAAGEALIGLPNIDFRGREWENIVHDKDFVYLLTGRYPTALFSAFKLTGTRSRKAELWNTVSTFLSISDWVEYQLSGVLHYEHSQASETLLYDIVLKRWSEELCLIFDFSPSILPKLVSSGTILGPITSDQAQKFGISSSALIIVGGGDTQLAVVGTQLDTDDVAIVSGTTTPIVKITDKYVLDKKQRSWTGRHVDQDHFMFETNAGVTGLNYQRLKEIFYPNEGYEVIEREVEALEHHACMACLGSVVSGEKENITTGGFMFDVPVSHQLSRATFIYAALWDIACSIKENYDTLNEIATHQKDFIWACGGGFQSRLLRQFIATLINKKVVIRKGYQQSSVVGGVIICNGALSKEQLEPQTIETITPMASHQYLFDYKKWKQTRDRVKKTFN